MKVACAVTSTMGTSAQQGLKPASYSVYVSGCAKKCLIKGTKNNKGDCRVKNTGFLGMTQHTYPTVYQALLYAPN